MTSGSCVSDKDVIDPCLWQPPPGAHDRSAPHFADRTSGIPLFNVSNTCATRATALRQVIMAVSRVGAETVPGVFAQIGKEYGYQHGGTTTHTATVWPASGSSVSTFGAR